MIINEALQAEIQDLTDEMVSELLFEREYKEQINDVELDQEKIYSKRTELYKARGNSVAGSTPHVEKSEEIRRADAEIALRKSVISEHRQAAFRHSLTAKSLEKKIENKQYELDFGWAQDSKHESQGKWAQMGLIPAATVSGFGVASDPSLIVPFIAGFLGIAFGWAHLSTKLVVSAQVHGQARRVKSGDSFAKKYQTGIETFLWVTLILEWITVGVGYSSVFAYAFTTPGLDRLSLLAQPYLIGALIVLVTIGAYWLRESKVTAVLYKKK